MPRYKRTADEAQLDIPLEPEVTPENVETLEKLRNMWEFAALMEYIHLFGDVVKIDQKFEIEVGQVTCYALHIVSRARRGRGSTNADGRLMIKDIGSRVLEA